MQRREAKAKGQVKEKVKAGGLRQKKSKLECQMPKIIITSHESRARKTRARTVSEGVVVFCCKELMDEP